ncbi:MAG: hypothetical protein Kow0068_04710 [Marinilabiliales bacterium]
MNKILIIIIIISNTTLLYCQINGYSPFNDLYDFYQNNNKFEIGTTAYSFYSSSSISSDFIQALYGKEYINNELKSTNNPKSINTLGNQDFFNVYYYMKLNRFFGLENSGIRMGVFYKNHRDIRFTDDFYYLMFYGNKNFAGQTANLDNCGMNLLTTQGLRFGFFQKSSFNDQPFYYYAGLSLIKGQDYQSVYLHNSSIYTAETGEYIDVVLNANYHFMDTTLVNFEDINGVGVAADFYFLFINEDKNYKIDITLADIGLMKWKNTSLSYRIDTTFRFEGLVIPNIFDFNDTNYISVNSDSIINDFYNKLDTATLIKALPQRINIRFSKDIIENKLSCSAGLNYIYQANQPLPYGWLGFNYNITDYLSTELYNGYGGYGTYHLGVGLKLYSFNNKLKLRIISSDILGFIIPKYSFSQSVFFNLAFSFGNINSIKSM